METKINSSSDLSKDDDGSYSDEIENRVMNDGRDSDKENEIPGSQSDQIFSTQLEAEMFQDVQEGENLRSTKSIIEGPPDQDATAASEKLEISQETSEEMEGKQYLNERQVSVEPELILHDLDTIIGENSDFLKALTQNENTESQKLHGDMDNQSEKHSAAVDLDGKNAVNDFNTVCEESVFKFHCTHLQNIAENTDKPPPVDTGKEQATEKSKSPKLIKEGSFPVGGFNCWDETEEHINMDVRPNITVVEAREGANTPAELFSRKRKLSNEKNNFHEQSPSHVSSKEQLNESNNFHEINLTQPLAEVSNNVKTELNKSLSGFFKAHRWYSECSKKPLSDVKRENLNRIVSRFFSSSQPNLGHVSDKAAGSLPAIKSTFVSGSTCSANNKVEENLNLNEINLKLNFCGSPRRNSEQTRETEEHSKETKRKGPKETKKDPKQREADSKETEKGTEKAEKCTKQTIDDSIETDTDYKSELDNIEIERDCSSDSEEMMCDASDKNIDNLLVEGDKNHRDEQVHSDHRVNDVENKYQLMLGDAKHTDKQTKENLHTNDLFCEFDNESDSESVVLKVDLSELDDSDQHLEKVSKVILQQKHKGNKRLQETGEFVSKGLDKADEMVSDSNESDDELKETQTQSENFWLDFSFSKLNEEKGNNSQTISSHNKEKNSSRVSGGGVEKKWHMHKNCDKAIKSNTYTSFKENEEPNVYIDLNVMNSPEISDGEKTIVAEKTIVENTPTFPRNNIILTPKSTPVANYNKLHLRRKLATKSPELFSKISRSTDAGNTQTCSNLHSGQNDLSVPETPSQNLSEATSCLANDNSSNSENVCWNTPEHSTGQNKSPELTQQTPSNWLSKAKMMAQDKLSSPVTQSELNRDMGVCNEQRESLIQKTPLNKLSKRNLSLSKTPKNQGRIVSTPSKNKDKKSQSPRSVTDILSEYKETLSKCKEVHTAKCTQIIDKAQNHNSVRSSLYGDKEIQLRNKDIQKANSSAAVVETQSPNNKRSNPPKSEETQKGTVTQATIEAQNQMFLSNNKETPSRQKEFQTANPTPFLDEAQISHNVRSTLSSCEETPPRQKDIQKKNSSPVSEWQYPQSFKDTPSKYKRTPSRQGDIQKEKSTPVINGSQNPHSFRDTTTKYKETPNRQKIKIQKLSTTSVVNEAHSPDSQNSNLYSQRNNQGNQTNFPSQGQDIQKDKFIAEMDAMSSVDSQENNLSNHEENQSFDSSGEMHTASVLKNERTKFKMKDSEIIKRVTQVIHDLSSAFNADAIKNDLQIKALRDELSNLKKKAKVPKTVIAVVGDTGSGKSSILNALLGHRCVLPTSGVRACTAVAVEIENNTDSDKFEADIEFLTEEEWDQELDVLMKDLTNFEGKFRTCPPKLDTDTYISYKKVLTVYGKVDKKEELECITNITRYLGKTETISSDDPTTFCKEVEQYITQPQKADSDTVGEIWPIVKLVRFRLPNCDVLSSGAVLVDLPGQGDSNVARERVAHEYRKNCSAVWIVSSIHRAIDNKTAMELLDEGFERQLFMDGKYGEISFICSKTDDLIPSEIIKDLNLVSQTQDLVQQLSAVEEELKILESSEADEENINRHKISQLNTQMTVCRRQLYGICAKERNRYATVQIKKYFIAKEKELRRHKDQEDFEEYDDYEDDSDDNNNDSSTAHNLPVFCCSASEYQRMKHPSATDGPPQAFSSLNETEIPLLRKHVHDLTSAGKRPEVEMLVESLGEFVFSIKLRNYLAEDIPVANTAQEETRASIEDLLNSWENSFGPIIEDLKESIDSGISDIQRKLDEGAQNAERMASNTCLLWGSKQQQQKLGSRKSSKTNKKSTGLPFATYKATIIRLGVYKSKAAGDINFNEDLSEPMLKCLTAVWSEVFSDLIEKTLQKLEKDFDKKFDLLSLCSRLHKCGVHTAKVKKIQVHIIRTVTNRLKEMVAKLKKMITNRQQEISRMITPHVQEWLTPAYQSCQQQHGLGAFQRMQDTLHTAIDSDKCPMFAEAMNKILSELEALRNEILEFVRTESKNIIDELKKILEPLWEEPDPGPHPQYTELREAILTACLDVSEIYQLAGIMKKEPITSLSPVSMESQSNPEEQPGPSWESQQSSRKSQPPDLSPERRIMCPRTEATTSSSQIVKTCLSQKQKEYSDEECRMSSGDSSGYPKLNQSQIDSVGKKHVSLRKRQRTLYNLGAGFESGAVESESMRNCERSMLKDKNSVKSRDKSILPEQQTSEKESHRVPVSERQQIAMIRQMPDGSPKDPDDDSDDDIVDKSGVTNQKKKVSRKRKVRQSTPEDAQTSLLREISKCKKQVECQIHVSKINDRKTENRTRCCKNHDDPCKAQKLSMKRKADSNDPVLPQKRQKLNKSVVKNSFEERIKNVCKNRVLRHHAEAEKEPLSPNENQSQTLSHGGSVSKQAANKNVTEKNMPQLSDVTFGKNRDNSIQNKIKSVKRSAELRRDKSQGQSKSNKSTGRPTTDVTPVWERSFMRNTISEIGFDSSEEENSFDDNMMSEMMKDRYVPSLFSSQKSNNKTNKTTDVEKNVKRKGRKVRVDKALAKKAASVERDNPPLASVRPDCQPVEIKQEPEDNECQTPDQRQKQAFTEPIFIDLTEDSD